MGLFQRIVNWFTGKGGSKSSGGSSGGSSTRSKRSRYDSAPSGNYGASASYRRAVARQRREEEEKQKKVAKAFKAETYLPNKIKAEVAKSSPTPYQAYKQKVETERKAYHKATGNRFNTNTGNKEHDAEARIRIKSGVYDADAAKFEYKYHPVRASLARGALSGVTFGLSDLAAQKLTRKEARGAEQYYQQNKNRAAETAGEIAGSLVGFGLTGEASARGVKAAAKALAPKAFEKGTARAVERTASSRLIRRAAEKEALKRFGTTGATEEVIASIAKRRAERAVAELGKDAAINLTTGLASDVSNSLVDSENWQEFAKNMGINAGLNVALGGATSLVPAFRVGRNVDTQALDGLIRRAADNADNSIRPSEAVDIRDMARSPRYNRQGIIAGAEEADQALNRAIVSDADNVRLGDLVGDRQVRVNPDAPNLARDANRQRTLERLVRNAEQGVPEGNVQSPLNSLVRIPSQNEAARSARINEINIELDAINNDILARRAVLSDSELRELNDRFSALMDERNALELSLRESDAPSVNQNVVDDIANADTSASNQEMADQVLKEDNAEAKIVKTESTKQKSKRKRKSKKAEAPTTKAETPAKPKAEPKSQSVDDFAQVSDDASEVGIRPDTTSKPAPEVKTKPAAPSTKLDEPVSKTVGRSNVEDVSDELGIPSNRDKVQTPTLKEVNKTEARYNREQATDSKDVLSRAAVTLKRNSLSPEQAKRVDAMADNGLFNYTRKKNKTALKAAAQEFHSDPEYWTKTLMSYADNLDNLPATKVVDTQYKAWWIVNELGPILKEQPELQPLHDACAQLSARLASQSGQILQLNGIMAKASPLARRRAVLDIFAEQLDKSVGVRRKGVTTLDGVRVKLSGNKEERIKQIKGILEKDETIKAGLNKIQNADTPEAMDKATSDLLRSINSMKTRTAFDYLQQYRISMMLGNPKTLIRNRLGNAQFGDIRQFSNAVGSLVEDYLAKNSSDEFIKRTLEDRTRGGFDLTARRLSRVDGKTLSDGLAKDAYDEWLNVKNQLTGGTKHEVRAPGGKTNNVVVKGLDWWTQLVSNKLEKDDARALERNFREAYMKGAKKLQKNGRDIADEKVKELLIQRSMDEAKIATFREYNEAAAVLNKYTNALYDPDAKAGRKAVGVLIEGAMPFRKTPMNILNESINYSPIGLAKGFAGIKRAAANGDAELLHTAIDHLASGLTGTGIAVAGYLFGMNTDAFTTNAGREDFDAKFKKQQGVQNYSVTFTDPITGKAHSYTLDWLVPTSTTFFAGVELANQLRNVEGVSLIEAGQNVGMVASRVVEPVMETSMLSGIYSIIEDLRGNGSNGDDALGAPSIIMREIGQNWINSLVPTAVGQTARTLYRSDKQLNGETDTEYFINSLKSKMGLANTDIVTERLGADTDVYGEVKNDKGKGFLQAVKESDSKALARYGLSAAKNFVLPMNIQEVDLDELDQSIIDEYQKRVKAGEDPQSLSYLFAKKQYRKTFKVGDEDIKMSNVELSTYNQAKTTGGAEGMRVALEGIMFNRYIEDSEGKKTILKDGYTAEQKQKLIRQFDGKSLREVQQWLYKQPQFKTASEEERKTVLEHLWNISGQGKSRGAKRVGERAVIESRGGDVNEYDFQNEISEKKREALQPYIDAGVLTYEEAVDFARYGGKTYYYENDEGGSSQTYFNKAQMIEYLEKKGYSHEKAEALFNSFKNSNAKPYGSSSGRRGYRRRGYRRRGRGGGSSRKLVKSTINSSPYKTKTSLTPKINVPSTAKSGRSGTTNLASALQDIQKTQAKVTPPRNK